MTAPRELEIVVTMHSDWAIGTGHGRHGGLDAVIERDATGLPFLRGKALLALLFDEARAIAEGLDEGEDDTAWTDWLEHLFGRPSPGRGSGAPRWATAPRASMIISPPLTVEDAPALRRGAHGLTAHELGAGLTTARPNVSIDPLSGTARDEMLRTVERATGGVRLAATWHVRSIPTGGSDPVRAGAEGDLPADWPAILLLLGAAAQLERIGGDRRRGAGRCTVQTAFDGHDAAETRSLLDAMIGRAEQEERIPAPPHPRGEVPPTIAFAEDAGGREPLRHRVTLELELLDPVIIRSATRGNVVETLDFIPGTVLLPLVARAIGAGAAGLIREGRLLVGDAVLAAPDGSETRPWPETLLALKDAPSDGADQGIEVVDATTQAPPSPRHRPRVGARISDRRSSLDVSAVERVLRIHNAIDPASDRPTTRSGGPFAYGAIAPGTRLIARVMLPESGDMPDPESIARALSGVVRLGSSKKDDYGRVSVTAHAELGEDDRRVPHDDRGREGSRLVVTAQTDVLALDDSGEPDPTVVGLERALRRAGLPARAVEFDPDDGAMTAAVRARRRESWHVGWGLPRASLTAIQAGSVIVIDLEEPVDAALIARLEAEGIGERRAEGFGRIGLRLLETGMDSPRAARAPSPARSVEENGEGAPTGTVDAEHLLVRRGWAARARAAAERFAQDEERRALIAPPGVTAAQLGNLREAVLHLETTGRESALSWLSSATRGLGTSSPWTTEAADALRTLFGGGVDPITGATGLRLSGVPDEITRASWYPQLQTEALRLMVTLSIRAEMAERKARA